MAKISIVSQRRRETRFPETKAQRRARGRDSSAASETRALPPEERDVFSVPLSLELPEFEVDDLIEAIIPATLADSGSGADLAPQSAQETLNATIQLELSPEQSKMIEALPHLVNHQEQTMPTLTCDLKEAQDKRRIVLQFSLHHDNIPEMVSLQDLCQQLKVGRRSVLRLIREGHLRSYRIGNRYRFAACDIKKYLEQSSSH